MMRRAASSTLNSIGRLDEALRVEGVSMNPGAARVTLTPYGSTAMRNASVKRANPAFDPE